MGDSARPASAVSWGGVLTAAALASVAALLLIYVLTLVSAGIFGLRGAALDAAAEVITGPAADLGLAAFVYWQALRLVRGTGERPLLNGLLVGAATAALLQLLIRVFAPPVYPVEALADFLVALVAGAAAGAVGARSLAGGRTLLNTTKAFKAARGPADVARAIVENMRSPLLAGVCILENPSSRHPVGSARVLACWPLDPRLHHEDRGAAPGPPAVPLPDHASWMHQPENVLPHALARWARDAGAATVALATPSYEGPVSPSGGEPRFALLLAFRFRKRSTAAIRTTYLTLAEEASTALANLRLIERERLNAARLSQADERKRLSRELHDTTKGSLAGIKLLITASLGALPSDDPAPHTAALRRNLTTAAKVIDETVEDHDRIIGSMRRSALEALPLSSAIRERADRWSKAANVAVNVTTEGYRRQLDSGAEDHIYAVLDEALTNVAKYARATTVDVRLAFEEAGATLTVRDDGAGFDPERSRPRTARGGGVGLTSMRERAEQIGGTLSIDSAPGRGAAVRFTVPARAARAGYAQMPPDGADTTQPPIPPEEP